jgi:Domain of Unknown Function (DUF748)
VNRRRVLRLVGMAAAGLVLLVAITLFTLPTIVRRVAISQLGAAMGRTVALDQVNVELVRGRLVLRGLRVVDHDDAPLLTVHGVDVRFSPRDLLTGHLRIIDAIVQAPAARIVRTGPNEFNISDLLGRRGESGGTLPSLTIERFALIGGALVIEDRMLTPARSWRVEGVELHVSDVSTRARSPTGVATLRAVADGSPFSLSVTDLRLAPLQFQATVRAEEVDASLAALYLPPGSPLSPTRGRVNVSATANHDGATGTLIALDAGFAGVELHRPGQASAYMTAPSARVTVQGLRIRGGEIDLDRLAVDGGALGLEDTRLVPVRRWQIDGFALEARGLSSARQAPPGIANARAGTAGARVEVWATGIRLAPLELRATTIARNVDLALLRLYLPPELPVHPERGVVNATVQVTYDAGQGARFALDAGLSNIELQRPAHVVTAPALRVTAEGISLEKGAVTVGRLAVVGDSLALEERAVKPVRKWPVQNLVIEAKDLSSRPGAVQGVASLRATVAGAAASVFVTGARFDPLELRATAILRKVDAALLRLYMPDAVPVELARGIVNASIQVDHAAATGTMATVDATLDSLEARGRDVFGTLALSAPSLRVTVADTRHHGAELSMGRVELSGSGILTDSRGAAARFDLTQMRIATEGLTWPVSAPARVEVSLRFRDRGELDGSGTAQLTAPLPTVAWAAELALQARAVDLAPLAVYVTAADGLGGRVRGKVTVNLAYGERLIARVRGDVGGGRFALADGGRTLLSLRRIDATELDVQWPGRVSIRHLRLRQPYALIERDRQLRFPLLSRFAPPPSDAPAPGTVDGATSMRDLSFAVDELIIENGQATVVDDTGAAPVRFEVPRLDLTARTVTWPATGPAHVHLEASLPAGGTLKVEGNVSAEPMGVDVTLATQDADLGWLHPYLGFRAQIKGRLDANLAVAGSLAPTARLKISGEAGLRSLDITDGQRSVLTTDRLRVVGIDATWPERMVFDRVRVRRSWALIERDRQGRFLLQTLLERPTPTPPRPSSSVPPVSGPPTAPFEFTIRDGIFEEQAATIIDGATTPPARIEVAGARLAFRDFSWPPRTPTKVELTSPMPAGGRLDVTGTLHLEPMRLEARAVLDGVGVAPAQPYLPIEGKVEGKMTGELILALTLDPVAVQVAGQARLQAFRLNDGERAVVTVGRVDAAGIDVDWPKRITLERVQFRRPRLLIERDAQGHVRLFSLVTPRDPASGLSSAGSVAAGSTTARTVPAAPREAPTLEIGTFSLDRASARFVDHTTTPAYAEELEDVSLTVSPLTTIPGRRMRFTAQGLVGGGTLKVQGEAAEGERRFLDFTLDLRNFVVPRANPYVAKFTGWTASEGILDITGRYTLDGTRLDTRHDLLARGLEVAAVDERDEVAQRIGLPFGMLVSLLKDSRGEIKLSLPVSGDLSTREFDFQEALWGAARNLSIQLIALPFSKIGSLFFSQDSKVKAVALGPALFEPGTDRLVPGMEPHLERVASFLRGAASMKVVLDPILIEADLQSLKRERVLAQVAAPSAADSLERARQEYRARWPERSPPSTLEAIVAELATAESLPPESLRSLATRRVEVVRQGLTRGGGIDEGRLSGTARRTALVEAAGSPRVEFDLRP